MAKGLDAATGSYSMTYGYRVGVEDDVTKDKLREYLNKYKAKDYK